LDQPQVTVRSIGDLAPVKSDSLLALIDLANADSRPEKIDVGVGVYRDSAGKAVPFTKPGDLVLFTRHVGALAEDKGTILSLNETLCVPYGCFSNVLKTKDFSPLEPDIVENKYYAQNIGEIKAISVKGESDAETLKQINATSNNNTLTN